MSHNIWIRIENEEKVFTHLSIIMFPFFVVVFFHSLLLTLRRRKLIYAQVAQMNHFDPILIMLPW